MEWTVAKQTVSRVEKHFNADTLDLVKLGPYQLVSLSGLHKVGDEVVFAPEKSVLPDMYAEPFKSYLVGSEKNRVKQARLRGEVSQGVMLRLDDLPEWVKDVSVGEDISERLGISKYTPPIPQELSGQIEPYPDGLWVSHLDVEQLGGHVADFTEGESVRVTEKLHGSQISVVLNGEGEMFVSSKGTSAKGFYILESPHNTYWQAARAERLDERADRLLNGQTVQLFGEVVPVQKGFSYGQTTPTIRLFDLRLEGNSVAFELIPYELKKLWVPVLYEGPFDAALIRELAKGRENVSGQALHIREGVVVRPTLDRRAADGTRLLVKALNPKYKDTGEEFN